MFTNIQNVLIFTNIYEYYSFKSRIFVLWPEART